MSASFTQYRQELQALPADYDRVMELLEKAGVRHGTIDPAIEKLTRGIDHSRGSAPVLAKSKPPVHGEDAHFAPAIDAVQKSGKVRKDGSTDFRVAEGVSIGVFTPETQG